MRFALICMAMLVSACTTILSKGVEGFGTPYLGASNSYKLNVCVNGLLLESKIPFAIVITVPIGIVDLASSTVLDTVLLPVDLSIKGNSDKKRKSKCSFHQ